MRKKFNTTGPCTPKRHYLVPALERIPDARTYVDDGEYFVVHAPRQTGKTTSLADLPTGVLVIFDRRKKAAPITERTEFSEVGSPAGRTITLLRA